MPKNNPPKLFREWSIELGDRKWQQDELELVLELVGDFFGRKKECVGAGISGGGPPQPMRQGRAPGGWAHPVPSWPNGGPLVCSQCQKFLNILQKNHISFSGHLENFYFWGIFHCTDNSGNRQKNTFYFISTK